MSFLIEIDTKCILQSYSTRKILIYYELEISLLQSVLYYGVSLTFKRLMMRKFKRLTTRFFLEINRTYS